MTIHALPYKQTGLSLSSLLWWSVILVFVAILGLKVAPFYLEYYSVKKNLTVIAKEAATQGADLNQIRTSFVKRAQIDNITSVTSKDIRITKESGRVFLNVDYSVKIPLIANVSLYIDFQLQSE